MKLNRAKTAHPVFNLNTQKTKKQKDSIEVEVL